MTGKLNEVVIAIKANIKDFQAKLKKVDNKLEKTAKAATAAGKTLSKNVTAPLMALAGAALLASEEMDKINRALASGTGATGAALEDLNQVAAKVFADTGASAETVGNVMGNLNTELAITGETLGALSEKFIDASRIMGIDAAGAAGNLGQAFEQWGMEAEKMGDMLDFIMKRSQDTGASFDGLIGATKTYGAVLFNAGFRMEEAIDLFAQLAGSGIEASRVMPGFNAAFRKMAAAMVDPKLVLELVVDELQASEDGLKSLTMATAIFGAEGAQRLKVAFGDMGINVKTLGQGLLEARGTVEKTNAATRDLSLSWSEFSKAIITAIAPAGKALANVLMTIMDFIAPVIADIGKFFSNSPQITLWTTGILAATAAIGPLILAVGMLTTALIPIGATFIAGAVAIGKVTAVLAVLVVGVTAAVVAYKELSNLMTGFNEEMNDTEKVLAKHNKTQGAVNKTFEAGNKVIEESIKQFKEKNKVEDKGITLSGKYTAAEIAKARAYIASATASKNLNKEQEKQKDWYESMPPHMRAVTDAISDTSEASLAAAKAHAEDTERIKALAVAMAAMKPPLIDMTNATGQFDDVSKLLTETMIKETEIVERQPGVWEEWGESVGGVVDALAVNLLKFDWDGIKANLSSLKDSFLLTFSSTYITGPEGLIQTGLKNLMKELDKLIGKLIGKDSVKEALLETFGGKAKGKVTETVTDQVTGSGGGGLSGGLSGSMNVVDVVANVATAVSNFVQNVQLARHENTLNAIELNTRRSTNWLGDQGHGSVSWGLQQGGPLWDQLNHIRLLNDEQRLHLQTMDTNSSWNLKELGVIKENSNHMRELAGLKATMTNAVKAGNKGLISALKTKSSGPVFSAVADPNAVRA